MHIPYHTSRNILYNIKPRMLYLPRDLALNVMWSHSNVLYAHRQTHKANGITV